MLFVYMHSEIVGFSPISQTNTGAEHCPRSTHLNAHYAIENRWDYNVLLHRGGFFCIPRPKMCHVLSTLTARANGRSLMEKGSVGHENCRGCRLIPTMYRELPLNSGLFRGSLTPAPFRQGSPFRSTLRSFFLQFFPILQTYPCSINIPFSLLYNGY